MDHNSRVVFNYLFRHWQALFDDMTQRAQAPSMDCLLLFRTMVEEGVGSEMPQKLVQVSHVFEEWERRAAAAKAQRCGRDLNATHAFGEIVGEIQKILAA